MSIPANLEILEKDLNEQIDGFKKRREDNKKKAVRVVIWIAILSAITTILLAFASFCEGGANKFFTIVAIVSNNIMMIINAWDGLFNHKRLWINYADTLTKLYSLRGDVRHAQANEKLISQEDINLLYERYKEILNGSNKIWMTLRVEKQEKSKK